MPIIILIPTVICIFALYCLSVQKVFLNIFIPVFIMLPTYYYWKVAALPPIDLAEAVLFPLGVAMFISEVRRWRFTVMDALIALFIFTCYYADSLAKQDTRSTFDLFFSLCHVLFPYMAGKLLIEHNGLRVAVVKRFVFCMFVACVISAYEYKMGQNPFTLITARYFPGEVFYWKTQIRWGFGRVSGPYGQSELGGMIFFFGLILALWLAYYHCWEPKFGRAPWLPFKKSTIITVTIAVTLLMTQARGPWLGALAAIPIALLGRARRVLRASILLTAAFVVFGSIGYAALMAYAHSSVTESNEQENAQYRAQLVDHYGPVAIQGGAWGWGKDFPRVAGQGSIDNEYLFVALEQGMVGLATFSAIVLLTMYTCIMAAVYNPTKPDRYMAFSLLGITVGIAITLFTVFLGNQVYETFFLIVGWSQAIRIRPCTAPQLAFEQVYT